MESDCGPVDQNFALQWVQEHVRLTLDAHIDLIHTMLTRSADKQFRRRPFESHHLGPISWYVLPFAVVTISLNRLFVGAGSVLQHIVAHGGRTEPQLFRAGITSSSFLPSQYNFDDEVPEVRDAYL